MAYAALDKASKVPHFLLGGLSKALTGPIYGRTVRHVADYLPALTYREMGLALKTCMTGLRWRCTSHQQHRLPTIPPHQIWNSLFSLGYLRRNPEDTKQSQN